jgi:autotransporter-associated beta strand protein
MWDRNFKHAYRPVAGFALRPAMQKRRHSRSLATLRAALLASSAALIASASVVRAQDATWSTAPVDNDFSNAANWSPATVPTGTAFFGATSGPNIALTPSFADISVGGFTFKVGAANYTITNSSFTANALIFTGAGIVVDGGSIHIINFGLGGAGEWFRNSSTAGSADITNNSGGFVLFDDSSSAGSATITTNASGEVRIQQTASGGTARFILNGLALLDISFLVSSSTTAGSIEGNGFVDLGSKNLVVGSNNLSTVFSGAIRDGGPGGGTGGSLTKEGTGTLILSGVNTYTGGTTVNSGTLQVDGSITSSTVVNNGGTLAGTGTVGSTTVSSGGTLAPGDGNAGAALAISGSLAFASGAIYLVQVSPSTASFASVTGSATLGGATVHAVFASGSYVAKKYAILTATGGVSGTFASSVVNTNLPSNFRTTLSYDANDAYLDLALAYAGGLNQNQQSVANALTNDFNANGLPLIFTQLSPSGLTQVSGELGAGSQQTTFNAMGQFIGLLTDPFTVHNGSDGSRAGAPAYAESGTADAYAGRTKQSDAFAMFNKANPPPVFAERWNVWAAGFGGSQTTEGNAVVGSNTATSRIYGTAVGADYRFSPDTIAGFALAGGGTNFSVNGLGGGRSDLFQVGAYVRHTANAAYISAAAAYGWQDITTDRTVTVAGTDRLRAEFNANAYSGRVEGGYRLVAPWSSGIGVTPYAAAQVTTFVLPAYAEQVVSGAGTFALNYGAKDVTDTRSELGIRTDKSVGLQDGVLTLRGRVAWAHDFNPDRSAAATFQTLPGASFVVNGAGQASDSALVTASAEKKWLSGWSAAATFEGEFSRVTQSYAGKGAVRYVW